MARDLGVRGTVAQERKTSRPRVDAWRYQPTSDSRAKPVTLRESGVHAERSRKRRLPDLNRPHHQRRLGVSACRWNSPKPRRSPAYSASASWQRCCAAKASGLSPVRRTLCVAEDVLISFAAFCTIAASCVIRDIRVAPAVRRPRGWALRRKSLIAMLPL